ncbi:alpha/beta fold hydrolase [Pontitalea aquivivens]|uniref:alpha/beta fold hydrolase n=1 Tax=Pontitalea aquivivens TaxID=3388663 RepID=UPI0039704833
MPVDLRAGQSVHWQTFGTGDRPAVAVHCMLASGRYWGTLAPFLPQLTMTAFDLPGQGKSGPYDGAGPYQKLSTQILASFITRPVDLIGHSFGACIALRLAVAAPEAVRSLTLIEPVLFRAAIDTAEWDQECAEHDTLSRLLDSGNTTQAARQFVGRWGASPWQDMSDRMQQGMADRIHLIAAASRDNFGDTGNILRAGGLESIDAPVMLIEGGDSPEIIHRIHERLAARLADVATARIPGAGHMAPMTHAAQVAGLVAMNLDRS